MGNMLQMLGAASSGYMEGKQMKAESQRKDQESKMAQLLQGLQAQKLQEDMGPVPPDYESGLQKLYPQFGGFSPKLSEGENQSLGNQYQHQQDEARMEALRKALSGDATNRARIAAQSHQDPFKDANSAQSVLAKLYSVQNAIAKALRPDNSIDMTIINSDPALKRAWDMYGGNWDEVMAHINDSIAYQEWLLKQITPGAPPMGSQSRQPPPAISINMPPPKE